MNETKCGKSPRDRSGSEGGLGMCRQSEWDNCGERRTTKHSSGHFELQMSLRSHWSRSLGANPSKRV